ncbi:phosphatase PAP2 family protein [Frankia sp. CiP1_Cm_nod2]|uniref:phosphatase PAP2 family protein n=1 Tax=Frankia sp. CiP1_Cm_nod2 TaxID=2897161 RepID=UPI002024A199
MVHVRRRSDGLPVVWVEVTMIIIFYYTYTATRSVAGGSVHSALTVGWDIMRVQADLHLGIERGLNHWLQGVPALAVVCCYYYATLHFIVTPAVLVWLYRKRAPRYLAARWTIVCTTVISLTGFFLLPTAPPRLLPGAGFIDTMASFHNWGWWAGDSSAAPKGLGGITNQFAAMPSLHCAWALWCGWNIARLARHRVTRVLGVLYPGATVFVVMATANHYVLDVLGGWFALGLGAVAATVVMRLAHGQRRSPGRPAGHDDHLTGRPADRDDDQEDQVAQVAQGHAQAGQAQVGQEQAGQVGEPAGGAADQPPRQQPHLPQPAAIVPAGVPTRPALVWPPRG